MGEWTAETLKSGKGEYSILGVTQLKTTETQYDIYILARLRSTSGEDIYAIVSRNDPFPIIISEEEILKCLNDEQYLIMFAYQEHCRRYCIENEEI